MSKMRKLLESLDDIIDGEPVGAEKPVAKPKSSTKFLGKPYKRDEDDQEVTETEDEDAEEKDLKESLKAQFEDYVKNKAVPDSKKELKLEKQEDGSYQVKNEKGSVVCRGTKSDCQTFITKKNAELNDAKLDETAPQSMTGALKNSLSKVEPGSKLDNKIKAHNRAVKAGNPGTMKTAPDGYHIKKNGMIALGEGLGDTIKRGVKSFKRGMQGWDKDAIGPNGERLGDPRAVANRAKNLSDKDVKSVHAAVNAPGQGLFGNGEFKNPPKHSPAGLQKRVLDREMKKRGLGESERLKENDYSGKEYFYFIAGNGRLLDTKIGDLEHAKKVADELSKLYGFPVYICDKDGHYPLNDDPRSHYSGGKPISSPFNIKNKQQGVKKRGLGEAAKWRSDDLEDKVWSRNDDNGEKELLGGNDGYPGDELTQRPGSYSGPYKRMTKKGGLTAVERHNQFVLKKGIEYTNKNGGLTGPKGKLPESAPASKTVKMAKLKTILDKLSDELKSTRKQIGANKKVTEAPIDQQVPQAAGNTVQAAPGVTQAAAQAQQAPANQQGAVPANQAQQQPKPAPGQPQTTAQQAPAPQGQKTVAPAPGQPTPPAAGQAGGAPVAQPPGTPAAPQGTAVNAATTPAEQVKGLVQTLASNPGAAKQLGTKLNTVMK